jgi:DNA-binding MarR family transcriptional regulator
MTKKAPTTDPAEPPDVTSAANELRIVIGQLVRRLRAKNTAPISQVVVLARLEREGPKTTSALAAAERVRPQSMAHTLAELEAVGGIARRPDPGDRRQVLIELTDEGRRILLFDRQRREGWLARAIEGELTPEEQLALLEAVPLLRRIAQA